MNGKDIKWLSKKLDEQRDTQKEIFNKIDGLHEKIDEKHIVVLNKIAEVDKCVSSLKTEVRIKSGIFGTIGGFIVLIAKSFLFNNK